MLGVEYYGRNFLGRDNLVCVDIGGTSTDVGIVVDGVAQAVDDWEVEWTLPLGVPAIDVRSIGAGGGSLIQVDHMGTLRVGPESAGADPGPVCYGRGGTAPTITDAHAVLGALRPETFLGGRMKLDIEAAYTAVAELGARLGMDAHELASEAVRLMNANIEAAVTRLLFERGVDLRRFSLFSFGGAGSLHAAEVARAAGIDEVIVPEVAGGFSAMGLVTSPPKVDRAIPKVQDLDTIPLDELNQLFEELESAVTEDLVEQGVSGSEIEIERSIYGMYTGQSFANELALPEWPLTAGGVLRWRSAFDAMYERLYGYSAEESPVTVTTLRVVATGARRELQLPRLADGAADPPSDALDGRHELQLGNGRATEAPFYLRERLLAGNRIEGPAVIEDPMTTILIPEDCTALIDNYGNVRISIGGGTER